MIQDPESRLGEDPQGPLGPGEELAEVYDPILGQTPQVVPAVVVRHLRDLLFQLIPEALQNAQETSIDRTLDRVLEEDLKARTVSIDRLGPDEGAIGEDDIEGVEVIPGGPVLDRMCSFAVGRQHPPQGAHIVTRGVGRKIFIVLFEHPRERGQRASRLGSHPAFDEIDLQDSVHVAREIEDDSCPKLLPAPTRPAPTGMLARTTSRELR